jgi:hypothetical protein
VKVGLVRLKSFSYNHKRGGYILMGWVDGHIVEASQQEILLFHRTVTGLDDFVELAVHIS